MVDQIIRPANLPTQRNNPVASEWMVVDNGVTVAKSRISDVVNAGRPLASQAEAEAGTNATKAMTPLTTKQSIASEVGVTIASNAQGILADSAVQPGDLAAVATSGDYNDLDNKPVIPPGLIDGDKGDVFVSSSGTDWRLTRTFKTVSDLLSDDDMGYSGGAGSITVSPGDIVTAQGFRYEIIESTATDNDVVTSGGVKLNVIPANGVSPVAFGAVGDGFDETSIIQKFANRMAGYMAIGELGKEYTVATIRWPSNTILFFIKFKTLAGDVQFRCPVTVDGTTATGGGAKSDLTFYAVHVDGNRQNQTVITIPSSEDGGRHGFRIVGKVSNLTLEGCSARYCACDGIAFYNRFEADLSNDQSWTFKNIRLINCDFEWNRRWGMAGDSIDGIRMVGGSYSYNGRDLNTTDPLTHGNRGARIGGTGSMYGGAFDFEDYGIGSGYRNVFVHDIIGLGNYGWATFLSNGNPDHATFAPRTNIFVTSCKFTKPLKAIDDGTDIDRPTFFMVGNLATDTKPIFTNFTIDIDCETWMLVKGVNKGTFRGRLGRLGGVSRQAIMTQIGPAVTLDVPLRAEGSATAPRIEPGAVLSVNGTPVNATSVTVGSLIKRGHPHLGYEVSISLNVTSVGNAQVVIDLSPPYIIADISTPDARHQGTANPSLVSRQRVSNQQFLIRLTATTTGVHTINLMLDVG